MCRFVGCLDCPLMIAMPSAPLRRLLCICLFRPTASTGPRVRVHVKASHTGRVGSLLQHAPSWGSLLSHHGRPASPGPGVPMLAAVSGTVDDGRDVVALLDEPAPPRPLWGGGLACPRESLCFPKPPNMSFREAARYPLTALHAAAAFHRLGWRLPSRADTTEGVEKVDCAVLIAGSSGRMPHFLVELLTSCGRRPIVAARSSDMEALRKLGVQTVNHDRDSFSTVLSKDRIAAVFDCVGIEECPQVLQEQLGAHYVSLARPELTDLVMDGALMTAARAIRQWQSPEPQCIWAASDEGGQALDSMLELALQGRVTAPPAIDDVMDAADQYGEAISWVRDCDSGLRLGFPGKNLWTTSDPEPESVDFSKITELTKGQAVARLQHILALDDVGPFV